LALLQLLVRVVSWHLRKVGGRVAVAPHLADVNFVAESFSQKWSLPEGCRIVEVSTL